MRQVVAVPMQVGDGVLDVIGKSRTGTRNAQCEGSKNPNDM